LIFGVKLSHNNAIAKTVKLKRKKNRKKYPFYKEKSLVELTPDDVRHIVLTTA
jgi:hypothetical protein